MARIFWVTCPVCGRKFYAATDDFRHKPERKLLCPFCGARFGDDDAAEIAEG
ncbi:MAG: hypothetical protein ACOX8W_03920 [bacterium]